MSERGDCDYVATYKAEIERLREALETLLQRIDEMPNPHKNPMRDFYNNMALWKDDARVALDKPDD